MTFRHHPPTTLDFEALDAQLRDGIFAPDGVLSFEQALALITEIRLLRSVMAERDAQIGALRMQVATLAGMLS